MLKNVKGLLAAIILSGGVGSANAAPIIVNGLEWYQPIDFLGYSWNSVNSVCSATTGICSGSLGASVLDGWTWASVDNVNSLFNHYLGSAGTLGPGPDSFFQMGADIPWAVAFFADGWSPTSQENGKEIWGNTRDSFPDLTMPGVTHARLGNLLLNNLSWDILGDFEVCAATSTDEVVAGSVDSPLIGAWLYRDASVVPSPGTFPLLGLGLAVLGYRKRKQTKGATN